MPNAMDPNGSTNGTGGWKSEKRRKESSKFGKETNGDRRDDTRNVAQSISDLHNASLVLSTRPEMSSLFLLRLYPLSLERSALTAQLEVEERYSIDCAQVAYDEERERVEDEWKRGRERVRERMLEGIEERRRRLREEKDGEGIIGDAALDMHSRPPITRKLRNKLGTSPPPTPHPLTGATSHFPITGHTFGGGTGVGGANGANATGLSSNIPITTGPFLNPHSLNVDDLPSPYPLPLTSSHLPPSGGSALGGGAGAGGGAGGAGGNGNGAQGAGGGGGGGGRRRVKGGGGPGQAVGGLGKSLFVFNVVRDIDIEADLGEIRRGNKRRRATAAANTGRAS